MKEVLTRSFWQGVRKTFYEALEDPPPEAIPLQPPAEMNSNASSMSEAPSAASASSEKYRPSPSRDPAHPETDD
jgi:hypothetical protein